MSNSKRVRIMRGSRVRLEANIHPDIADFLGKVTSKLNVPLGRVVDLAAVALFERAKSPHMAEESLSADACIAQSIETFYSSSERQNLFEELRKLYHLSES